MCASAGFPWLPEKEQQAFEAAAAAASASTNQEAATPAAAHVRSTASAAVQPLQLPKTLPGQQSQLEPRQAASLRHRDATNGSELSQYQHQQQAKPFKAAVLDLDSAATKAAPEVLGAAPAASGKAGSKVSGKMQPRLRPHLMLAGGLRGVWDPHTQSPQT